MRHKYTFDFNRALTATLRQTAKNKGITVADVLRRAIASYAYFNLTMEPGQKISIIDKDDNILKDVYLP